eukprot:jgi/Ulvmu1/122/UM001_0126.1
MAATWCPPTILSYFYFQCWYTNAAVGGTSSKRCLVIRSDRPVCYMDGAHCNTLWGHALLQQLETGNSIIPRHRVAASTAHGIPRAARQLPWVVKTADDMRVLGTCAANISQIPGTRI